MRRAISRRKSVSAHRALREHDVGRGIFEQHRPAKRVLHFVDMLRHPRQGFLRVGQGQEIVEERALVGRPGEVLGNERRLEALGDRGEPLRDARGRAARASRSRGRRRAARAGKARGSRRGGDAARRPRPYSSPRGPRKTQASGRVSTIASKCSGLKPTPTLGGGQASRSTTIRDGHARLSRPRPRNERRWRLRQRARACYIEHRHSRFEQKIFPRTCNGRRNETKPV